MAGRDAGYVTGKGAALGECPVWDDAAGTLYWIDCLAPALLSFDPATGAERSLRLPEIIGSFGLRAKGGLIAAFASGFALLDPETGAVAAFADPEPDLSDNRFNDGRCDRAGRFWAGTMHRSLRQPTGALYRLDPDGRVTRMANDITVPNGLAVSPDGRTLYFADSPKGDVLAFDLDPETGALSGRRVFVEAGAAPGFPDGATVDAEGGYWSARWEGGCVARFTPAGKLDRVVKVPAARVTACAFGGPALDTLYITTASIRPSDSARSPEPEAGGLFACAPGVAGLPEPRFGG
jgi:sugar lactone lactonase YvrE